MGGQLLSGVDAKRAVGITAVAEAITCLVGFVMDVIKGQKLAWGLAGFLTLSAVAAIPLAVFTVKSTPPPKLKKYVGVLIALLGALTLYKVFQG